MRCPLFAWRQRYRLNGDPVYENPFAPWSEDDVFPWVDIDDLKLAGYREIRYEDGVEEWLESVFGSYWPLLFLIEQSCHDGELLDRDLRLTRLAKFPLDALAACEEAIATVPPDHEDKLFFMIH